MRNLITTYYLLVLAVTALSCNDDDVRIINQGDNLPIKEAVQFKFDENSGDLVTEEYSNTTFSIEGKGVNRMPGVENNALFFDGLSNEIPGTIATSKLSASQLVISLWASPKSYPVGTASMLALTTQGSSTGVMLGINKFGQLVFQYFINGDFAQQVTSESIPKNKWNHIVVGLNPSNQSVQIYVNRVLVESENVRAGEITWPPGDTPFSIGKNTMNEMLGIYDVDYFSGAIDEVSIYSGQATQDVVNYINEQYSAPAIVDYEFDSVFETDSNRPTFHAIPDYGWANESYGLIYLDNQYHMFYQKNDVFLGIANQNWGHFTSPDLIQWKEDAAVLWPSEGWDQEGIWAGSSIILQDGTPAVAYTGVDGIKAGVGVAFSDDNFQTLFKDDLNPVISQAPSDVDMDFRDPYVWYNNNQYHMLVGSGVSNIGGNVVYYNSSDFKSWDYQGIAFQGQTNQGEGLFWEVPILYEFPNGKDMLLVQKTPDANTPARTFYWIGEFVNGQFLPEFEEAKNLEIVNGFLSPTVTTDQAGNITAIGIIPDEVDAEFQKEQGWANLFSVPQVWSLNGENEIEVKPHPDLNQLRSEAQNFEGLSLSPSNSNYLNGIESRHFELEASIHITDANQVGFEFGKTPDSEEVYKVYYDVSEEEWVIDASKSSLSTLVRKDIRTGKYNLDESKTVNVRIFVDGSVLEVFIDGKSHFTGRFFPTREDAKGIDLFTTGGDATADVTFYNLTN